jgi:glycine cleavage system H protein
MTTRYTREHEWIRLEGNGVAAVGISDYAQDQLGDVVFVELPPVGKALAKGDEAAVVESVKAASEVYAPVAGKVVAVNDAIAGEPGLVNRAPEGEGWFLKLKVNNPAEIDQLMDEGAYAAFVKTVTAR